MASKQLMEPLTVTEYAGKKLTVEGGTSGRPQFVVRGENGEFIPISLTSTEAEALEAWLAALRQERDIRDSEAAQKALGED